MKHLATCLTLLVFGLFFLGAAPVLGQDSATEEEVVEKCKEAAAMLLENPEAGIAEIANKEGKFVWKDTYVFLMNLDGHMLAHPIIPQLTEKGSLLKVTDKNKQNPKLIFIDFVEVAKTNGEGWVDYMWPRPGASDKDPTDKLTYIYRVGQTDLLVGAGIYK
ncbi:MAG: cache domain-containing protein [Trichloromonadaceae bacterium]